jgi:hypothetical protein
MIGSELLRNLQLRSGTEYTIIVNVSNVRLIGSGFDLPTKSISSSAQYVPPAKRYFLHASLVIYFFFLFFRPHPIKLKLGLQIGGRLLVPPRIKLKLGLQNRWESVVLVPPRIKLKLGLQIGGRLLVPPGIKLKLGLQIGGRVY